MTTHLEQSRTFPVAVDRAYEQVLTTPLPQVFGQRHLLIPAIREVRDQVGEWGTDVGQTRTIVMADGGTLRETLTKLDRPRQFAYEIGEITGMMKFIVRSAKGSWTFTEAGTGTRVSWTWLVEPSGREGAAVMPAFGAMWKGSAVKAMQSLEGVLVP